MLQAADAIDSPKTAGWAKTAEKHGSSKVRNPNKALLTAMVLVNLLVEPMDSKMFCWIDCFCVFSFLINFRWQLLQALRRQQTSLPANGAAVR